MHSEEVMILNVALRYCDQLKNNLQASILHVQMLNRKYNTRDYTQSMSDSIIGSPRKNISMQQTTNVEPQVKKQIRSVKDIKHKFNNIIVNGIKLRREVETTTTQLKLLRKDYQVESPYIIKRRLQSANNSAVSSPAGCRHGRCFQNSSDIIGGRDRSRVAAVNKTNRTYSGSSVQRTPQRKRTRQSFNQLVMNKEERTPDVNGKKFHRFQSTPIKINKSTLNTTTVNNSSSSSLPNSSKSFVGDKLSSTMYSPIKPCFRNNVSNASKRELNDSPKRICWTPIVNVNKISIYQVL